jgi:phosphatidate cytidylyltransferase
MKRLLTALAGIPVTVLLVLYSPDILLACLFAAVSMLCLEEFLNLGKEAIGTRPGPWALVLGGAVTLSFYGDARAVVLTLTFCTLVAAVVSAYSVPLEMSFPKVALALMGFLYCGVLIGFLFWIGRGLVLTLLGAVWIGDAAAYYGGRLLGRHSLAPRISPKKTVEGAFAGLLGSMVAGVVIGVWLTDESSGLLLAASFCAAVSGQLGDLAESALKRSARVKDSSSLLPGHGGMLDRLDSVLFAAPVYFWFFRS